MGYPVGTYPNMPELVRSLQDNGFKVLGYLYPQFRTVRAETKTGLASGYFLKQDDSSTLLFPAVYADPVLGLPHAPSALYAPTNPEGVAWWQGLLRRLLVEYGYDGWMHDFGEQVPVAAVAANGMRGEELHNLYPTLYQRMGAELCQAVKPDFMFFSRSGYTGSNAWAPAIWPRDQHTDWSWNRGLASSVPAGLSLGICAANTWGPDIGGFFHSATDAEAARSTELWIRWCQFGALTPLMRDHLGVKKDRTPDVVDLWSSRETIDTWRTYARLHNSLVPYL